MSRTIKTTSLGMFPDYSQIKDEATLQFCKDLNEIMKKLSENISDDVNALDRAADIVEDLPDEPLEKYRGKLFLLQGATDSDPDTMYTCIRSGIDGSGQYTYAFKQIILV
jgi:hypothetical protein